MPIRFKAQKRQFTPLALAIGLAFPLWGFAQTDDDSLQKSKPANKNETITVVATGSQRDTFTAPMMVDVIENNSAESRTATSAVDMLKYIPGLVINGSGRTNGQDISLRGYNSQGVLTLVDGVRQTNQAGHINGIFLDPTLIKRVEVVKGSSALLYGSGALGGVVSYQTVDAKDLLNPGENGGFHVYSTAGTGDHSFGIGLSAFGRTDNLDGVFSFASRDRGKIKQSNGIDAPNQEHINNLFGKGTWYIDQQQSLTGNIRYYHNDAHQPSNPQQSLPNNDNPQGKRTTAQTDGQLEYHLKPSEQNWLDLNTRVYYSNLNIRSADDSADYANRKQYNKGIKAENTTILFPQTWSTHTLKYGSEAYQEKQTPGGTSSFPSARTNFASGWLQDEIALRDLPKW